MFSLIHFSNKERVGGGNWYAYWCHGGGVEAVIDVMELGWVEFRWSDVCMYVCWTTYKWWFIPRVL